MARSLPDQIAYARNNPGRLKVAYAGAGTPQHIAIELFQMMAGVRVALVPYPGSAPALADLPRAEVDVMFDPAPSSMPHIRAGRLIALATTGTTRSDALPGIPTVSEFVPGSPVEFSRFIAEETGKYSRVIRAGRIKPA